MMLDAGDGASGRQDSDAGNKEDKSRVNGNEGRGGKEVGGWEDCRGFIYEENLRITKRCFPVDRKSTRLNSSHAIPSRMPSSA